MYKMILSITAIIGLTGGAIEARPPHFEASIIRTSFGIPHIRAKNWGGIGYGVAYAYAQDNLCLLAEEFVTVAGERSLYFGPGEQAVLGFEKIDNLSSDIFLRSVIDLPVLRRGLPNQGPAAVAAISGYIAGYNRLLRDLGPQGVPAACRGKAWVRPINLDDMLRLNEKQMLLASSLIFANAVVGAAPPGSKQAAMAKPVPLPETHQTGIGSNGWAFGAETTKNGRGLVVGNPHFPWEGPARFYQMHVTIAGIVDAMGASIAGSPLPTLGFNRDVAWTHTVTAAQHFNVFQLKIDPANPTAYLIDGKSEPMTRIAISIPMPKGAPPILRTLYATRYGPVVALPAAFLNWTKDTAFSIRDANHGNQRGLGAWIEIARARSTANIRTAVERSLGLPWVNTIAADRAGNVLHADITAVPNLSAQKIRDCATPLTALVASRLVLIDGSRSACNWDVSATTPAAGLMPAVDQAVYMQRDYVANSNDSYWLSNPKVPHIALSPILGLANTARSLRTRSGLVEIERRLAGTDGLPGTKVDHENAKTMAFANKSLAAELVMDRLLTLCKNQVNVAAACSALGGWNRRFDLDSRGAYLFSAFWAKARNIPDIWAVQFDAADPVNTPRDFVIAGAVGAKIIAALAGAAGKLSAEKIALDARWGDVQFAVRGDQHIPIHGADGMLGVLNVQISDQVPGGIIPRHGSSYVQVVSFDGNGPVADAVLSYSQSTNPASPYYADQTRLYSVKGWHRLPFSPKEIAADHPSVPLRIAE